MRKQSLCWACCALAVCAAAADVTSAEAPAKLSIAIEGDGDPTCVVNDPQDAVVLSGGAPDCDPIDEGAGGKTLIWTQTSGVLTALDGGKQSWMATRLGDATVTVTILEAGTEPTEAQQASVTLTGVEAEPAPETP